MTLYTTFADGRFTASDRIHAIDDLSIGEFLQLQMDFASGRLNSEQLFAAARARHVVDLAERAEELFEQARERRSGTIA